MAALAFGDKNRDAFSSAFVSLCRKAPKDLTAERLKRAGADVRYFGALLSDSADSIIKSRFTIIQWDSHSARLTYPKEDQVYHYNWEYAAGDPATDLAQDLIRLLIKLVPEENRKLHPAEQPQPLLPNT
ncbi:MAG: hypothetical protein HFJ80_05555 [Clostridiales bacterium]|nr:hypothetical protein [Clostridiales bacterium]